MERIKELFKKNTGLRLTVLALFATVGVVLAHPEKGVVATLPVAFLFFLLAAAFGKTWIEPVGITLGVTLLYAGMTEFGDAIALVLLCTLSSLLAVLAVRGLWDWKKKKTACFLLLLAVILALILPSLCFGLPTRYLSRRAEALDYVAKTYPDQSFSRRSFYYSPAERAWLLSVSYAQNDGELESRILFSDTVQDGFADAFAARALEQRKAVLSDVLAADERLSAVVDGVALLTEKGEVFNGSYGNADPALYQKMHFTVTFRREILHRADLAKAAVDSMALLKEAGVEYGKITFVAQDAGIPVYSVDADATMSEDEILLNVKKA